MSLVGQAYDAGDPAVVEAVNDVALQLFTGIYNMVCSTGVGRVIVGGCIVNLGQGFLKQLQMHAQKANGNHLVRGLTIDYGHIGFADSARGIAEYYLDKRFLLNHDK